MRRYRGPRRVIFIGIYASASRARLSRALCASSLKLPPEEERYCRTRILDSYTIVPRRWEEFIVVYRRLALRTAPILFAILSSPFRVARREERQEERESERDGSHTATPAVNIIYSSPPLAALVNLIHQSRICGFIFVQNLVAILVTLGFASRDVYELCICIS